MGIRSLKAAPFLPQSVCVVTESFQWLHKQLTSWGAVGVSRYPICDLSSRFISA